MTTKRDAITALFTSFAGQNRNLVIPRPYIDFCQGDILAALLLSQILYWADRTDDQDGWFAKSYEDWQAEIGMTEYQIKRAINGDKRRKNQAFALKDIGIEISLKRSKFYHGAATLHYRINEEKLRCSVLTFLGVPNDVQISVLNNVQNGNQTLFRTAPEQCSERSTESTTESTTETTTKTFADGENGGQSPTDVDKPDPDTKPVQPHIAIIDAYWAGLPGGKPIDEDYARHLRLASKIVKSGYTAKQITRFMQVIYDEATTEFDYKKWHTKPIPLEEVAKMLPLWWDKAQPKVNHVDYGTSADQMALALEVKRQLTERVNRGEFPDVLEVNA